MSVNDARVAVGLPNHPKTKRLLRKLGDAAGWYLLRLILWTASDRPDGDLAGMSDEDIELAVDWSGDEGAFVQALADVGFLDGAPGARAMHDWSEHNPYAAGAPERKEQAKYGALVRHHGREVADQRMPGYAKRSAGATPEHADGPHEDAGGMPNSAASMPPAEKSNAPSPSPSPIPKDQEQSARGAPRPDEPGSPPAGRRRSKITIKQWLDDLADRQEHAVPDGDPIFAYAEIAGVPDEFLRLAWEVFRDAAIESGKTQKDWRLTFRNYVQRGYLKLWYFDGQGACCLTTAGIQAQRVHAANEDLEDQAA